MENCLKVAIENSIFESNLSNSIGGAISAI